MRRQQLEQQIRAILRVDENYLSCGHLLAANESAGECGGEEQVVDLDRATAALAFFGANCKQLLGAEIPDDQLARFIGQENRVGDGVDDAVKQVPLTIEAGISGDVP